MDLDGIADLASRLRAQVEKVLVGQTPAVDLLLASCLSNGHILLEGVPGTAKTLLARTFSRALSLTFKRIQFTPDLMPGDVIGTNLFDFHANEFRLTKGPVFTQILLADEINRTPPKTQAALLEAMQERSVTIDGRSHDLDQCFMVIATQNPIEHQGTYPLPEAQLDRFLFKHVNDYPSEPEEQAIVAMHGHRTAMPDLEDFGVEAVAGAEDLQAARRAVEGFRLSDDNVAYIVAIVRATRTHPAIEFGASPRAGTMLGSAARAAAAIDGRDYVIPDDIKTLAPTILCHRLVMAPGSELEGLSAETAIRQILDQVPAPR